MRSFRDTASTGYKKFSQEVLSIEKEIKANQAQLTDAIANVRSLRTALEDYISKMNVD